MYFFTYQESGQIPTGKQKRKKNKAESVWWTRAQESKLMTMMDCPLYTRMSLADDLNDSLLP